MTTQGWTADGYEGVREAFDANFADGLEVGAAFSAYHQGAKVVDLWGGVADVREGTPWEEDSMAVVFSTTKGATAICANRLIQEGRLSAGDRVVQHWPEFGEAGKGDITVEQLLSHQAGLAWVDEPLTLEQALAWDPMIHALERQAPAWEPGTAHGYHAITFGNLVGEVVGRVTGESVGTYFRELAGDPLGLDFWIGLPEEHEHRVARLVGGIAGGGGDGGEGGDPVDEATQAALDAFMGPDTMLGKALTAGGAFAGDGIFNTRAVHAAEVPSAAGIGDARSIARLYAACLGEVDGVRILDDERVRDASTQRTKGPNIVLMDLDIQFGLGFFLPSSLVTVGGPKSFGHFGAGGSVGWADPEAGLSFGYVMNRMDMGLAGDVRSTRLIDACYAAIA